MQYPDGQVAHRGDKVRLATIDVLIPRNSDQLELW